MSSLEPHRPRNERLVDLWSATHVVWGVILTCLVGPFLATVALMLWEPFEVLVLSPLLARRGMEFGHEALQNSLLDLVFNAVGVFLGLLVLAWMPSLPLWPIPLPGS